MSGAFFTTTEVTQLLDELKVGVLLLEGELRLAYANEWFLNTAGLTEENVAGRTLDELFPGKITNRLSNTINDAINGRRSMMLTTRLNKTLFPLLTQTGEEMHQRVTIKPFGENEGLPRCIIQVEDVTENNEREKILKQKRKEAETDRAYLNAILQGTAEGIITIDSEGVIETYNDMAEKMFGYSPEETIGQGVSILIPEDDREDHHGYVKNSRLDASRIVNKARGLYGRRKDGSKFPLEINVSKMEIADHVLFIGIVRDITKQKEVDRIKNEFVSTVSHELRTPLTSIKGSLGLVSLGAFGALPEPARDLIEIAKKNSERLINLVNDILDVEKLESGTLALHFERLDLSQLVADAIETNDGLANEFGVRFVPVNLAPDAMVRGDSNRLNQVVANLLSNAAKFSPAGQDVKISVKRQDDLVKVSVSDHGPGIPEEFRSRIFERFSQADGTDTRDKGGSGLGLNITKSFVEKHGGAIDYESEVGVGSTFFFTIPVLK